MAASQALMDAVIRSNERFAKRSLRSKSWKRPDRLQIAMLPVLSSVSIASS